MSLHLALKLSLLSILTVTALLPSPHNVKMIAVDMNYTLHWDWKFTQLENPVNFTVEYVFNDQESYEQACAGSSDFWCHFSVCSLPFSGSYLIRVRAEAGQQRSNWTKPITFIPDEDMQLTAPRVDVKADIDVLTLTMAESVMNDCYSTISLIYSVQYWEKLKPEEKQTKIFKSLHAPLSPLKSKTEYCVQVSVSSKDCNHSSNYTSPQCVYTKGHRVVWPTILLVLGSIPLFAFLYKCHKFRRKPSEYTTPESILAFTSVPLLLEAQEECCTVAHVILPAIQPAHTLKEEQEQEQEETPELQVSESVCHWSDAGSAQDSGFISGLES